MVKARSRPHLFLSVDDSIMSDRRKIAFWATIWGCHENWRASERVYNFILSKRRRQSCQKDDRLYAPYCVVARDVRHCLVAAKSNDYKRNQVQGSQYGMENEHVKAYMQHLGFYDD